MLRRHANNVFGLDIAVDHPSGVNMVEAKRYVSQDRRHLHGVDTLCVCVRARARARVCVCVSSEQE